VNDLEILAHIDRAISEIREDIRAHNQELYRRIAALEAAVNRTNGTHGKPAAVPSHGVSTGAVAVIATVISTVVATAVEVINRIAASRGG
jgi:hypothetical protein